MIRISYGIKANDPYFPFFEFCLNEYQDKWPSTSIIFRVQYQYKRYTNCNATAVHQFYHTLNVTVPDIVRVIWTRIKYIICFQLWCLCDAQLFVCLVMIESVENGSFWMSISSERISLPLPPQRERERVSLTDSLLLCWCTLLSLSLSDFWFCILPLLYIVIFRPCCLVSIVTINHWCYDLVPFWFTAWVFYMKHMVQHFQLIAFWFLL